MTAPRDANAIAGLLWPWGEIRRLETDLAFSQEREALWRNGYNTLKAEGHARLERLGGDENVPADAVRAEIAWHEEQDAICRSFGEANAASAHRAAATRLSALLLPATEGDEPSPRFFGNRFYGGSGITIGDAAIDASGPIPIPVGLFGRDAEARHGQ